MTAAFFALSLISGFLIGAFGWLVESTVYRFMVEAYVTASIYGYTWYTMVWVEKLFARYGA